MSSSLVSTELGAPGNPSSSDGSWSLNVPSERSIPRQIAESTSTRQHGATARTEDLLASRDERPRYEEIRAILAEACQRAERGETSVASDILRRFSHWRAQLEPLLATLGLLPTLAPAGFPAVGDVVGDFPLQVELGRGAHGRTFLATQRSLGDRLIVLKITPLGCNEHLSLARLQHMHIVPLYFEQILADRHLRVLGMPYLGGATLAQLLHELSAIPADQRDGRLFLDALDRCTRAIPSAGLPDSPLRKRLENSTYTSIICWLGACLAEALHYAHERNLIHLDIKPSNVLITNDGQPLLLDFHLARAPIRMGLPSTSRVGGTTVYASPEQLRAIAALRHGQPVTEVLDGRTDVYSLGLMLDEALRGARPQNAPSPRQPLERRVRCVSPGLSDIIEKCLATDAADRYPDAAALALDLRRHLADLPLRGVANRSLIERWRKWRRREPAALGRVFLRALAAGAVLAGLTALVGYSRHRCREANAAFNDGRRHLANHHYLEAVHALRRGLALAPGWTDDELKQSLQASLRQAQEEQREHDLHTFVNLLRFRFGVTPPPDQELRYLSVQGERIWSGHRLFMPLAEDTADQTRADLLDLATILADMRAHDRSDGGLERAAQLLAEAQTLFGSSPALARDLREYTQRLGRSAPLVEPAPAPRTAWEHYDLGRSYLRSAEYASADEQFRRAVALRPGEFWPYFFQGVCRYRLGRFPEALAAFDVCVALAPGAAACYYNRAKVHEAMAQIEPARADYSHALDLEPALADAALNRGILWYQEGRHDQALADFERARKAAADPQTLGLIHYNLALVHLARNDRSAALAALNQAIEHGDAAAGDLYRQLTQP